RPFLAGGPVPHRVRGRSGAGHRHRHRRRARGPGLGSERGAGWGRLHPRAAAAGRPFPGTSGRFHSIGGHTAGVTTLSPAPTVRDAWAELPWASDAHAPVEDSPPPRGSGWHRLVRGRPEDPAWARPALLVLLVLTGLLYMWDLGA